VVAVRVTQISVGVEDGGVEFTDEGEDPVPVLSPPLGEIGGVVPVLGAPGSV
jgi:hypothetical protein